MNAAHIHLILNHVPVVAIPVALCVLLYARAVVNLGALRFAFALLAVLSLVAVPVYLSGTPAEHVIEARPGVSERNIEPHEDAAAIALGLSLALVAASGAALLFGRSEARARVFANGILGLGALTSLGLGATAYLGGRISHAEVRPDYAGEDAAVHSARGNAPSEGKEVHEDDGHGSEK